MLFTFLLLVFLGLLVYSIIKDSEEIGIFSLFMIIVMLVFVLTSTGLNYLHQINDITELNVIENRKEVYEERAEEITFKLKSVVREYVEHEEGIFENLSSLDVQLYAVKYPEIKSNKLYSEYSERLNNLYNSIYRLRQDEITLTRNIERRKRYHIHVFTPIIPRE